MSALVRQRCQAVSSSAEWKKEPEMPPFQQQSRINIHDLKAQMVKRIGPERASQYFNHFKGYISLRFNKTELDKLVVLTIGKENIGLHNEIIKALLSNAIKSETPPQFLPVQDTSKPVKGICRKPSLQFPASNDTSRAAKSPSSVRENGIVSADSPRKGGAVAFGQIKSNVFGRHAEIRNSLVDLHRPVEHVEGVAEQLDTDLSDQPVQLGKRPRVIVSPSLPDATVRKARAEQLSLSRVAHVKHGEAHDEPWENGLVKASSETSCYASNVQSAIKLPLIRLSGTYPQLLPAEEEFLYSNNLPSVELLQRHMEYVSTLEGLEGVSRDSVEIVNQGIDSFLKRLIGACIDLVKARSGAQPGRRADRQAESSAVNLSSVKRVKQLLGTSEPCSSGIRKESMQNEGSLIQPNISFLDFKVAMGLNPQQLGPDWPLQLEKIHLYSFDN